MERYDSISDQVIVLANKSEQEVDGRTLIQVIKLIFENGTNDAMFSEMYARLCCKMMEQVSPKIQDHNINLKNAKGKPFAGTGGQLFRKGFERGWVTKETTANQAVGEANEKTKAREESEPYSDECYAANKARRHGLGLIRFLGELFKLQMLTERVIHECIKKLLANVKNPEEDEIECLTILLTTVGSLLDKPKARAQLDLYFSRMEELTKNKNVNARAVFKLQDVVELRTREWISRDLPQSENINKATPTTPGPSSPFAGKKGDPKNRGPPMSPASLTSPNTFPKPHSSDATPEPSTSKAAWVTSDPAPRRRKLQLLPRTRPLGEEPKVSTLSVSEGGSDDETVGAAMSETDARAKIEEDFKGFFSTRMLDEAESHFSSLPTEHRHCLVDILVMKAICMKEPDVKLARDLFVRVRLRDLCSPQVFEEGFNGLAQLLDDLAVDIPKAWSYFVMLLKGSGLDQDDERLARIAEKTMNPDKLNRLL
ncbi:armadillo-type protein [Lactifluus subvellereus]|nr:armadillo-type protein [Lactifluus subvellereus]